MLTIMSAEKESTEGGFFARHTQPSRRAIVLAQEEARSMAHHYLGAEHLLLGLLRVGDGVARAQRTEFLGHHSGGHEAPSAAYSRTQCWQRGA
jgi:ATP-dependent Clp protease ATP-binding subunit ClpA